MASERNFPPADLSGRIRGKKYPEATTATI